MVDDRQPLEVPNLINPMKTKGNTVVDLKSRAAAPILARGGAGVLPLELGSDRRIALTGGVCG